MGIWPWVGSSPARNGEKAKPWMSAGQGGSRVGLFRYAHTAKVTVANTAAISRLGIDFMAGAVRYQEPVFGMDFHGSAGASALPFCSSSMEMLSGERTKAMRPSRGGRRMVTPCSARRWQVA